MKTKLFLGISLMTFGSLTAKTQCTDGWAKKGGGPSDYDRAFVSVTDHLGNVIVAGQYNGTASFSASSLTSSSYEDVFLAKYDHDDNLIWVKSMGGFNTDSPSGVAVDDLNNIYITGTHFGTANFSSITLPNTSGFPNAFVAKYTSAGNVVWANTIGNTDWDQGGGIAVSGNKVYITGGFSLSVTLGSTTLTSAGGKDYFIARMDTSGMYNWADDGGGTMDDYGVAIEADNNGNMYATGMFFEDMTIGTSTLINQGYFDVFTVSYSNTGVFSWAHESGGSLDEFAGDLVLDSDKNVYICLAGSTGCIFGSITVNTFGDKDAMLAKYDNAGNIIWAKKAGGINRDIASGLSISPANEIYLSGNFNANALFGSIVVTPGGNDYPFIATYDTSGTPGIVKYAGGALYDAGNGTCYDPVYNNLYLCGNFSGTTSFGTTSLTADVSGDAFIWNVCENLNEVHEIIANGPLTVYPNPVRDLLLVEIPKNLNGPYELKISNLDGKIIYREQNNTATGNRSLDLKKFEVGVYILTIINPEFSYNSKVIKN